MKIERVSENQLKLTLTRADLSERDLRLEDLISPSEKTQKLFRDLMEQALEEYDFIEENSPLMVEATPNGIDGIMIIVTKIDNNKSQNEFDAFAPSAKDVRKWKRKPLEVTPSIAENSGELFIYSFSELDDAIHASLQLNANYQGESSLYKNENRFFLIVQNTYTTEEAKKYLEFILEEYGQKHISTPLSKHYLFEHGEMMIENKAIQTLAMAFGE